MKITVTENVGVQIKVRLDWMDWGKANYKEELISPDDYDGINMKCRAVSEVIEDMLEDVYLEHPNLFIN